MPLEPVYDENEKRKKGNSTSQKEDCFFKKFSTMTMSTTLHKSKNPDHCIRILAFEVFIRHSSL